MSAEAADAEKEKARYAEAAERERALASAIPSQEESKRFYAFGAGALSVVVAMCYKPELATPLVAVLGIVAAVAGGPRAIQLMFQSIVEVTARLRGASEPRPPHVSSRQHPKQSKFQARTRVFTRAAGHGEVRAQGKPRLKAMSAKRKHRAL